MIRVGGESINVMIPVVPGLKNRTALKYLSIADQWRFLKILFVQGGGMSESLSLWGETGLGTRLRYTSLVNIRYAVQSSRLMKILTIIPERVQTNISYMSCR